MAERVDLEIRVADSRTTLRDLGDYLTELRVAYAALLAHDVPVPSAMAYGDAPARLDLGEGARRVQAQAWWSGVDERDLHAKDLGAAEPLVARIEQRSPLVIGFVGVSVLLALAAVLSGGEVEMSAWPPKIKVKIPPLAKGIAALKKLRKAKK